jgi:hypothetical protein
LSTELNLLSAEVLPHLTAIEATDGRQATRLTRLATPPLPRWSGWQASLPRSSRHRAGARDVRHDDDQPWEGRTPPQTKPHTAKASSNPAGIYENASGDDDRGAVTTRILNQLESHPTTRDNTIETWQTTCEAAEDERGRERPCPSLGRYGAPSIKSKPRRRAFQAAQSGGDPEEKEADGQNPNGQTARSSRRARRAPPGRCLALKTQSRV